ncbi:MAG: hypothetical protein LBR51_05835 [Bacteroidales bacterium]|jgi:hypothetical protein|nr:hypothetical protein [Bacteroidales bacterium]
MAEDELEKLTLYIATRPISVKVRRGQSFYYKKAEETIKKAVLEFSKKWSYTDHQDLLSKVLLDQTVRWIEQGERLLEYEQQLIPKMQQLSTLSDSLMVE